MIYNVSIERKLKTKLIYTMTLMNPIDKQTKMMSFVDSSKPLLFVVLLIIVVIFFDQMFVFGMQFFN